MQSLSKRAKLYLGAGLLIVSGAVVFVVYPRDPSFGATFVAYDNRDAIKDSKNTPARAGNGKVVCAEKVYAGDRDSASNHDERWCKPEPLEEPAAR